MVEDIQKLSGNKAQPRETGKDAVVLSVSELEDLFRNIHPRIFAYIRYRVNDLAEAEDLTADILERALTNLSSYDADKGAFSTWIFRIAHNMWVNHLKQQKRRGRYHAEFNDAMYSVPDGSLSPEQDVVRQEQTARMLVCLDTLSERQQEILTLRFAGQLTNREIASVLDMNERTVSVTILRALRKLRQLLSESDRA
ncbi:MAG: sigma-70 family RNA polymerase sigma factor [Anaerolineae bacterium]|nr:sigma-70 family RNA polymerase sigma factor [Anaerolineae bacterium]